MQAPSALLALFFASSALLFNAQAFPLPEMDQQQPTKVAILGVGRSGTTFLMGLLATLDENAFVLPEPYFSHGTWAFMPRVQDLLDCSALGSDAMQILLMWPFACANSQTILNNGLLDSCLRGALPSGILTNFCQTSKMRIAKLLRLPSAAAELGKLDLIQPGIKTINLVRNPRDVLRSQLLLGWHANDDSSKSMVDRAEHICQQMLVNKAIAETLPETDHMTIKYEKLVADFHESMALITQFILNSSMDSTQFNNYQLHRSVLRADLPKYDVAFIDEASVVSAVQESQACRVIAELYGY